VKFGGYREVALRSIAGPGDVKQRQAAAHVQELARDIRELGDEPINAPAVVKAAKAWKLIAGRDRYSALLLNGAKRCWVRVIDEATPQELHDLEVSENLHRRVDDRDKLIAERVRQVAARVVAERVGSVTNVTKLAGRPKSAEGEARERVAAALGTTPEAVKQALHRAKERDEAGEGVVSLATRGAGPSVPPPPPIDLHGHELPDHVSIGLPIIVGAFDKADRLLRQAQAAIGELGMTSFSPGVVARLKSTLHDLAAEVRAATPTDLCPYCNGNLEACQACHGLGAVTRHVYESAPSEQRAPAGPGSANVKAVLAPKSKPRKGITVQVNDGPAMTIEEAQAWAEGMASDDERPDLDDTDVAF
jgi:hypothetical protein